MLTNVQSDYKGCKQMQIRKQEWTRVSAKPRVRVSVVHACQLSPSRAAAVAAAARCSRLVSGAATEATMLALPDW
jgi:hypothetical protein